LAKTVGPYVADFIKAAKLLQEAAFQLPSGGFDSLPADLQTVLLDNARIVPLQLAALPTPITCDILNECHPANARDVG
jgi:hypothetical protein